MGSVGGVLLLPLLLSVRVCSVCKGEGREIEELVPIILRARPVRWVSLRPCTAYSVIPTLAHTRGPGSTPAPAACTCRSTKCIFKDKYLGQAQRVRHSACVLLNL